MSLIDQSLHTTDILPIVTALGNQFCAFLRAVRRRMVIAQTLERIGISIFLCAAASLILLAILLWCAKATNRVVAISMFCGLSTGIVWSFFRRPTLLAAALLVDRQWQTAELISSAWLCHRDRAGDDNPWIAEIMTAADVKCRDASAFSISVGRLAGRAWGAIGLAVALAITLGFFGSKSPADSSGSANNRSFASISSSQSPGNRTADDRFVAQDNRPILMADPQDLNGSHLGQNSEPRATNPNSPSVDRADPEFTHLESTSSPGTGSGSARTEASQNVPDLISRSPVTPADPSAANNPLAKPAGGTGAAGAGIRSPESDITSAGLSTGSPSASKVAPPWTTNDWPADVARATSAVNAGRVPAEYHDLVREYFANPD